jgi:hypothetical protein
MSNKRKVVIDTSAGGNGDVWMRLVSFYIIAALKPELELQVLVPGFLKNLAVYAFGNRMIILSDDTEAEYCYTSMGIKDLIKGICSGEKYIAPYHRSVIHDKRNREFKDYVNILLFNLANYLGVVQVPAWKWIEVYQGYMDIIGLKMLRNISYEQYKEQLQEDYEHIYCKLNGNIPVSPELVFPEDLKDKVVVFPTGTSRQFIPVWWAKKYLPDAYFAFFFKDKDAIEFEQHGLKVINFYKEPGDIIALSNASKWTVSTDSFPSHLLQYATKKCTITITEVLKSRIISPVYEGKVVDAQVSCHPCLHLERKSRPTCVAGYTECLNWKNVIYTQEIIKTTL